MKNKLQFLVPLSIYIDRCTKAIFVPNCNIIMMKLNNIENSFPKMSLVMRKPAFCICENKDADQLRGNREADQRLCFRYTDSTIPILSKSEISSL